MFRVISALLVRNCIVVVYLLKISLEELSKIGNKTHKQVASVILYTYVYRYTK